MVQIFEWKLAFILVKINYRKAYFGLFFIWYVIRQLVKMDSNDNNNYIRFVNIQSVKWNNSFNVVPGVNHTLA